MKIIENVP